jgi:hypothetical protein
MHFWLKSCNNTLANIFNHQYNYGKIMKEYLSIQTE